MKKLKVVPLDDHTWRIEEGSGQGRVYMYLLEGDREAVLIDTGMADTGIMPLLRTLTGLPVFAINTHGHLDHIARNAQFARVCLHPADIQVARRHSDPDVRLQFLTGLCREKHMPKWLVHMPPLRQYLRRKAAMDRNIRYVPMEEGDIFDLGGRRLEILLTPGHTPGSVSILDVERRQIFTGDTACTRGVLLSLEESLSVEEYCSAIRKLKAAAPRYDRMLPAHHETKVGQDILEEYLECAGRILEGKAEETYVESAAGAGYQAAYKRIGISYSKDKIYANGD